jgi:hypothetical protein
MEKLQNQRQLEREGRADQRQLSSEERATQAQIDAENRKRQQGIDQSTTLGKSLAEAFPEGTEINEQSINNFAIKALQGGSSIDDISTAIKTFQDSKRQKAVPPTQFGKESAKSNVKFLQTTSEAGKRADELLGQWDELDKAIDDPSRSDNLITRGFKALPGAQYTYGNSDQIIAQNAKELITNFTNLKGIRLSDAKLKWLESIAPQPWKSREANRESSSFFKRMAQIQSAYHKIANGLAQQYEQAGIDLPSNFIQLVEEAVAPLQQEIDEAYKNRSKDSQSGASFSLNQTIDQMPSAKGNEGMEITDDKGKVFRSDGVRWKKVK